MNAEPEMLWGLPVVVVESMPRDEIIVIGHRILRAEGTLTEEDGRWVARLTGVSEGVE